MLSENLKLNPMKVLFLILILITTACGNGKDSSKNYNESRELIPNPEGYQKDTFPSDTVKDSLKKDSVKPKIK
ncbi:hypothetical protein CEY12_08475 [Chryseobacterium sp. T16E-39]|nr:hypothetical protein CEY12_08475 [Chryseobacterium sp. T16E-39]